MVKKMKMKHLRERANLRTMDVAIALGVAESSVRNWEHGRSVPRLEQARHLLKLYNCSFDELCDAIALTRKEDEVSA
jgi:DNA-binding transcriptional regulator YiaG